MEHAVEIVVMAAGAFRSGIPAMGIDLDRAEQLIRAASFVIDDISKRRARRPGKPMARRDWALLRDADYVLDAVKAALIAQREMIAKSTGPRVLH